MPGQDLVSNLNTVLDLLGPGAARDFQEQSAPSRDDISTQLGLPPNALDQIIRQATGLELSPLESASSQSSLFNALSPLLVANANLPARNIEAEAARTTAGAKKTQAETGKALIPAEQAKAEAAQMAAQADLNKAAVDLQRLPTERIEALAKRMTARAAQISAGADASGADSKRIEANATANKLNQEASNVNFLTNMQSIATTGVDLAGQPKPELQQNAILFTKLAFGDHTDEVLVKTVEGLMDIGRPDMVMRLVGFTEEQIDTGFRFGADINFNQGDNLTPGVSQQDINQIGGQFTNPFDLINQTLEGGGSIEDAASQMVQGLIDAANELKKTQENEQ